MKSCQREKSRPRCKQWIAAMRRGSRRVLNLTTGTSDRIARSPATLGSFACLLSSSSHGPRVSEGREHQGLKANSGLSMKKETVAILGKEGSLVKGSLNLGSKKAKLTFSSGRWTLKPKKYLNRKSVGTTLVTQLLRAKSSVLSISVMMTPARSQSLIIGGKVPVK